MHLRSHNLPAGFTLVEILAAVAVISILVALILGAFGTVKVLADRTKDASNLRQISAASMAFANENQGMLLSESITTSALWVKTRSPYYLAQTQPYYWEPYLADPRIYRTAPLLRSNNGLGIGTSDERFYCYVLNVNGRNSWPDGPTNGIYKDGNLTIGAQFNRQPAIPTPSKNPFIASYVPIVSGKKSYPFRNGFNVSYVDGHVQFIKGDGVTDEFQLAWDSSSKP